MTFQKTNQGRIDTQHPYNRANIPVNRWSGSPHVDALCVRLDHAQERHSQGSSKWLLSCAFNLIFTACKDGTCKSQVANYFNYCVTY